MSFAIAFDADSILDAPRSTQVNTLNGVLRGELAAVETYEQALGAFADRPALHARLRELRDEHKESVRLLQDLIVEMGGVLPDSSGRWGSLASAVTGTAKICGPATVLYALQQGAEMGINDYLRVLDAGVTFSARDAIVNRLIPRCEEHVAELEDLRAQMS